MLHTSEQHNATLFPLIYFFPTFSISSHDEIEHPTRICVQQMLYSLVQNHQSTRTTGSSNTESHGRVFSAAWKGRRSLGPSISNALMSYFYYY
jgi:hypothetical protein